MSVHAGRLCRLREALGDLARAVLITDLPNVRYLSGFTGSYLVREPVALVITAESATLVTDARFALQVREQAPDYSYHIVPRMLEGIAAVVSELGVLSLAFEEEALSFLQHRQLGERLPGVTLIGTEGLAAGLRMLKEPAEVAAIGAAAELTDAAYAHLCRLVRPGITERQLALEAEFFMRRQGAEGVAFEPIVAAGPRSALPHAVPSPRPLQPGDLVIMDLGARLAGYCADLTRTVAVGRAGEREREIYRVCHQAQAAGLAALRPGAWCREVDEAAREVITAAGYGEQFNHGLGHAVGMEPHEPPRLARTEARAVAPGMVLTVEPGIYLPELGGVRIEDLVEVTAEGTRVLSHASNPAELPVLG